MATRDYEGDGIVGVPLREARIPRDSKVAGIIREKVRQGPAYLTFDIDCLDPATAPGTGTPVPGGLTSHQALSILRAMKGMDFAGIGGDVNFYKPRLEGVFWKPIGAQRY